MKQKVMKVGNSLGVTVPASFVKAVGVAPGSEVKVKTIPEKGKVEYLFGGICQLPLSNILQTKSG